MGLVLPATVYQVRPIDRGDDLHDIVSRVQDGDPTVGWRGDPEMDVYERGVDIAVYGFDRRRERYQAAVVSRTDPGWRHELLRKLRDGDWQDPRAYDRMIAAALKVEDDDEKALTESRQELSERFASAVMRDNGIKRFF